MEVLKWIAVALCCATIWIASGSLGAWIGRTYFPMPYQHGGVFKHAQPSS